MDGDQDKEEQNKAKAVRECVTVVVIDVLG